MGGGIIETITKCLNEWNAIIEALGTGKQTILIRKTTTQVSKFLLYPTRSYVDKDEEYLKHFKPEYLNFVKKYALPKQEDNKRIVKYIAFVEDVFKYPNTNIRDLDKYHIWTNQNVKDYLSKKDANIWLLRVYKLKDPVMTTKNKAIVFANVSNKIPISNIKSVLSNNEFEKIKKGLINL